MNTNIDSLFKDKVLGHPAGLFVLFFTEMWERFSFYGMRVLLINFLTMAFVSYNPGWEWSAENAGALFGTYAGLLYLTPIAGGIIADKLTGYRWAVVIGAALMTLGHAAMALETELSLYLGLGLLVIGTGFFKPNITSIISEMYKDHSSKKDGAYTIFYMGVNAGAFFGMMLCGYLAEKLGWSYGFGLAGIFMLLGTLQFWLAKPLFGSIGDVPSKKHEVEIPNDLNETSSVSKSNEVDEEKRNPFTKVDIALIIICSILGLFYLINDPLAKIGGIDIYPFRVFSGGDPEAGLSGQNFMIIIGLILFFYLAISRILRYSKIVLDKMIAFLIFCFFTVFFWMSFEQGATSLVLFARDSVDRVLTGSSASIFNIVDTILTIGPLAIITWVLYLLAKKTFNRIAISNVVLILCFVGIWLLAAWKINRDFNSKSYLVSYDAIETTDINEEGKEVRTITPLTSNIGTDSTSKLIRIKTSIVEPDLDLQPGSLIPIIRNSNDNSVFGYVDADRRTTLEMDEEAKKYILEAKVEEIQESGAEIPVSWFSILNSFFIITLASFFSKWWDSKYNPSGAMKYGLGLIIMAIGFGLLAWGSHGVQDGVKVSMIWLILAYLFHTMGELCLSPVGLSYVSKLVPARMIALMFGVYYLAIAIGNKLAAQLGGQIETITEDYSLSTFFLIFTIVPAVAGLIVIGLNPVLKKLMHGER
jgi:POT family proton-dependent oligopeptide transporter